MVRTSAERQERLVQSTIKVGWSKFGVGELDDATFEYIAGVANTVVADSETAEAAEIDLLEHLGPLLAEQDFQAQHVDALCKAIARCACPVAPAPGYPPAVAPGKGSPGKGKDHAVSRGQKVPTMSAAVLDEGLLCSVPNLILMYMGGSRLLLEDTTFHLARSHRYGVVGSNGAGKTTLMERIADGAISQLSKSNLRFVHIRHEALDERANPSTRAEDFARSEAGETNPWDDALDAVGFTEELRRKALRELSGGWRVRLLLATAVARSADVLLLDEPTNHLDAAAVDWLVTYLTEDLCHATCLIVSHDAPFLDKVCTDIVHIDERKLKYYDGNFASFQQRLRLHDEEEVRALLQVRETDEPAPKAAAKSRAKAKAQLPGTGPGTRQGAPARSAAPDRAEAAEFRMSFPKPGKVDGCSTSKKVAIELKDVSFKYALAKEYALRGVDAQVTLGSRIAIVGANGSGKSTLLALLCGELRPSVGEQGAVGEVHRQRSLRLAYIAQHHSFHLGEYARCTPAEYIQLRFRNGYDGELQQRLTSPGSEEEERTLNQLAARYGKYGKRVEALVSRVKRKNEWKYEVQWKDLTDKGNTFETVAKLRQLGVERMATALDERLAISQSGNDERPLTTREIAKHFEGFGLSEELVSQKSISTLSGGQKCKLMIGAAFWTRPHVVCFDEPTNFLDFETVDNLAKALKTFRGGVVVVSHNEDFLAATCDEIWSVENHVVTVVRADAPPPVDVDD